MVKYPYRTQPLEHQADAVLNQSNPVSGTKYIVLDTTKNVKILSVFVSVAWTGQPTPLELHVTVDGITKRFVRNNPASATAYIPQSNPDTAPASQYLVTTADAALPYLLKTMDIINGRSVKIEAEIIGGTVSNLSARVKYAKY